MSNSVRIGVVKERKPDEGRVALTPGGARELIERGGASVTVERGAGLRSGFADGDYEASGATISGCDRVWSESELVVKVKEPIEEEYGHLRRDLTLFTYLHLAADRGLTEALLLSGITALAFETVQADRGGLPLLTPMSEVAGRLAAHGSAYFLQGHHGGRGILFGPPAGAPPATVLILGGGVVGYHAALIGLALGARVRILDISLDRLRQLDQIFQGRAELVASTSLELEQSLERADVVIGAVLLPGGRAPRLLTRAMLGVLNPGAVLCDVAIDQGGCFETSHPTTHTDPVYEVDGVVHYCVANLPGAVPRTSSRLLTTALLPYLREIAEHGIEQALATDAALARGLNVRGGAVTHPAVAEAHGLPTAQAAAT